MKKLSLIFLIIISFLSCNNENNIYGEWQLKSWDIGVDMDLNKDAIKSSNLLDEVECNNDEVLTLKQNNTLASVNTFSPVIKIFKLNSDYMFNIECSEGSLGYASAFKVEVDKVLLDQGGEFTTGENNQLTRIFKKAVKIYNSDFSEVLETKDLILTYTKK